MIYALITLLMMVLTIFCFRRYIHPGTHKGFVDQDNNYAWVPFGENWWDTTDIPVSVTSPLAMFTRLWFWFVTGLNIKEWAAIHRHNSFYEHTVYPNGKPGRIERAKLFLKQRKIKGIVDDYSIETPDTEADKIYQEFPYLGPVVFLVLLLTLFGPVGILMWTAQMAWLPFWCSESANGWELRPFEQNRLMEMLKGKAYYE